MVLKRNTQVGKNNFKLIYLVFLFYFCLVLNSNAKSNLEGTFTDIKILDKISSKNTLLKLKNGDLVNLSDIGKISRIASLISNSLRIKGIYPTGFLTDLVKLKFEELRNIHEPIVMDIDSDLENILKRAGYKKGANETFSIQTKIIK